MKALRSACHELFRYYEHRLPRGEHIEMTVDHGRPFDDEHWIIKLSRMKGEGRRALYREASVDVDARELRASKWGDHRATLDVLDEKIRYLVLLLFPTPAPKSFRRLRRRPLRGRA